MSGWSHLRFFLDPSIFVGQVSVLVNVQALSGDAVFDLCSYYVFTMPHFMKLKTVRTGAF